MTKSLKVFENYKSLEDLKQFPEKNTSFLLYPFVQIVFLMTSGQIDKGKNLIIEQHKIALTPQTITDIISFPDGTKKEKIKTYINQNYVDSIERLAKHYDVEL